MHSFALLVVSALSAAFGVLAFDSHQPLEPRLAPPIEPILSPSSPDATAASVCAMLQPKDKVTYATDPLYPLFEGHRYFTSTEQTPACIFKPTDPTELGEAMKMIGKAKAPFAVSGGRHSGNKGFSSTTGVQIDMRGFLDVVLAPDKSYVDIGAGIVWESVYQALEGSGVIVAGGRVSGVGTGLIAGGGGFAWITPQVGLSIDTLLEVSMVLPNGTVATVTAKSDPDLFWAIKGGANQFGITTRWRLATIASPAQVYGGGRIFAADQIPAVLRATAEFAETNKDPKATLITSYISLAGVPLVSLIVFYHGSDPGSAFQMFDGLTALTDDVKARSFTDLVLSTPVNATSGIGFFHGVSVSKWSQPVMDQVANQTSYWGSQQLLHSGSVLAWSSDVFLQGYMDGVQSDSAWPHSNSPQVMDIECVLLTDALDEVDYWRNALFESARMITEAARADGQDREQYLYPNYALDTTLPEQLYGPNLPRLAELKKRYDPDMVMSSQTGWFGLAEQGAQ